jgi:hypothetical protein
MERRTLLIRLPVALFVPLSARAQTAGRVFEQVAPAIDELRLAAKAFNVKVHFWQTGTDSDLGAALSAAAIVPLGWALCDRRCHPQPAGAREQDCPIHARATPAHGDRFPWKLSSLLVAQFSRTPRS